MTSRTYVSADALLLSCERTTSIKYDGLRVVLPWRNVGRLYGFEVETHVRLQLLHNETGHEHKVGSWFHVDGRRLSWC